MTLAGARALLQEVRKDNEAILIGLSGGKDSLVTLDLCKQIFPRVECFFMYLVRGLRCCDVVLEDAAKRWNVTIHQYPHWRLGRYYKQGYLMPLRANANKWRDTKLVDIEQLARAKTGINYIAYGHRMTDSLERRGMLHKIRGLDKKACRAYPLWEWKEKAVYAYIRQRGIPIPATLMATGRVMTGVNLRPDTLLAIRNRFPEDYKKILEVFPYAGAQVAREEFRKGWGGVSAVSEGAKVRSRARRKKSATRS